MNKRIIFFIAGGIFVANILILDVWVLTSASRRQPVQVNLTGKASEPYQFTSNDTCVDSCQSQIDEIKQLLTVTVSPKKSPTATPRPTRSSSSSSSSSSTVKEYFVPLGSGSSTAEDWTDVPGVQSYVDSTQYGSIKQVVFEASLHTPTGNQTAYARLYNVTDKHPVWNSEVQISGGSPQLLISAPITLDSGNKLYQVQMKTQLKSQTNLNQARIHITTN